MYLIADKESVTEILELESAKIYGKVLFLWGM